MVQSRRRNLKWTDIDMAELDLEKLVSHFGQSNKAEGKSPKTISWYGEMLHDFIRYIEKANGEPILSKLNIDLVREFIVYEQERGLSPYSIQGKVRALKAFSSWLFNEGYTCENILLTLKVPKAPLNLIEPLTDQEIDKLISYQNPLTAIGSRNIAILILLLDSGIRVSELCSIKNEDAHIEEGYLKVFGKGSRERIVPIGALAQKVLWRYVFHFRPEPTTLYHASLFLTLEGKPLKVNAVKLLLNRWGKNAGVTRLHAHLCRHTYATNFLCHNCGDVFRLQQILGHTTLEMVRKYVHYASTQALMNGRIASPVDQMGIRNLRSYKIDKVLRNSHH
jgi:integrase/recombinase XerC/integrase/recombinase XerD